MQASLKAVLFSCALVVTSFSYTSSSFGVGLCEYLGIGSKPCGCGNPNCCDGCEPDRWIDGGCGCEASCGCGSCGECCEATCGCGSCGDCCEASCGCGSYCVDGRKFAGRTYNCGCESYMPMCGCTGPACCESACGCGDCCESSCGCEASCGCGSCGDCCEPSCGCGGCNPKKAGCCSGLFSACGRMCSAICGGSGCGCSGEMYWCEWHNDPPRCCDPCSRCGQWVGPSADCGGCGSCGCGGGGCSSCDSCGTGGYGYAGAPTNDFSGYAANRPTGAAHGGTTFAAKKRPNPTAARTSVARTTTPTSPAKARNARRPQQGANQQVHR